MKIPLKIKEDGGDSRANVTYFEMGGISHFDQNVENLLNSLSQIKKRIINPKQIEDPNEER